MNWILTILFILAIFSYYRLIGEFIADVFKISNIKKSLKLILGFLGTFLLGFLVGMPSQFFHINWNIYFWLMTFVFLITFSFCFYKYWLQIKQSFIYMKSNWKLCLINHLKEYWFIYLMVIISSFISMSNQMPYYYGNYDDSYYIGKVINQVGSVALSNEEYTNGSLISLSTITLERILNTYELTYGYFATIFKITIPFFCRASMVIHNYILIYIVYKCFSEMFVSKKNSQYTVVVFSLFWVSNGYLSNGWTFTPYTFKMFDAWQMQTAIFYGGSVVRTMAMPILIIFGKDLIKKFTLKNVMLIFFISCTFVSFSTIFIQLAILLGITFMLVKSIYMAIVYYKRNRLIFISSLVSFLAVIGFLFLTTIISDVSFLQTDNAKFCHDSYIDYHSYYVGNDIIMKFLIISLLAWIIIMKDKVTKFACIAILIYYLFFIRLTFVNLMTITSFNYFFVSLRSIAALQYILLILTSCLCIYIIESVKCLKRFAPVFSVISLSFTFVFFLTHIDKFMVYTYDGSGANQDGYSLKRVLENQYMVPELITQIGNYLDTLPYGNYKLFGAYETPYDESNINVRLLTLTSNRAEIYTPGAFGEENSKKVNNYFKNKDEFINIIDLFIEENLDYVLIFNDNQVKDFVANGFKIAFSYNHNGKTYYLVALSERTIKIEGDVYES